MGRSSSVSAWTVALLSVLLASGCAGGGNDATPAGKAEATNLLEVTAIQDGDSHKFVLSRDSIPQGWATIRFKNAAPVTHFALLSRIPEGHTVDDYRSQLAEVAQNMVDAMLLHREPSFPDAGSDLAPWYADVKVMGGPGLTSPGDQSEVTLDLTPGSYVLECYIKTPDGYFHHVLGMLHGLTVLPTEGGEPEPTGTLTVTLSNSGIEAPDSVAAGPQTVAVHFAEQKQYENLSQNDVHLARLSDDTDLDALNAWMNSMTPSGLMAPPAPAEFLGGVQEMSAGSTAYLSIDLTPGRYAWISEVPDPQSLGMLKPFTVTSGR